MKNETIWKADNITRDEYDFVPLDNIGTPAYFKVEDWENYEKYTFVNEHGNEFTRNYLHTTNGLLALSSTRLMRQLKPFADSNEKRTLVIQRWCEGKDTRATTFKVELNPSEISTKKPKTAPRKTKKQ